MPLSAEIGTPSAGRVPIVLSGALDQDTVGQLRTAIRSALQLQPTELDVNFAQVSFMDSSGLGAIVAAKRWCDDVGCSLRLEALNPALHRRFEISGLIELFGLSRPPG
ncbi:STAS domain-containing protein [Dactylosporangium sp. CA-139066]|uniref:STAS domain-containing protein n=1 Tax=Dactylosporangium sp. CA-139066 TaxID=3239930 RepID=UPI003D8DBD34